MPERVALPDKTVMEIRLKKSRGATLQVLADEYGIAKSAVSQIVNGKRYGHLPLIEDAEDPQLVRYRKALMKIAETDGEGAALARKVLGL